jgi:hypothetical protein
MSSSPVQQAKDLESGYINDLLKNAPAGLLPYTGLLSSTLSGLRNTTERATRAFKGGDPRAGAGAILEIVSVTVPLFPVLSAFGPFGVSVLSLVSAIFGVAGAAMSEAFLPQSKSLSQQIREELKKIQAENFYHELTEATNALQRALDVTLKMAARSRTWAGFQDEVKINLYEGNTVTNLGTAGSWLLKERGNAELRVEWNMVFDVYWYAAWQRTLFASTMLSKLRVDDSEPDMPDSCSMLKASTLADGFITADQGFAHQIHRAALNNGAVWHVGDNGDLYKRDGVIDVNAWENSSPAVDVDDVAVEVVGRRNVVFTAHMKTRRVYANNRQFLFNTQSRSKGDPPPFKSFCVALNGANSQAYAITVSGDDNSIFWTKDSVPPTTAKIMPDRCRVTGGVVIDIQARLDSEGRLIIFLLADKKGAGREIFRCVYEDGKFPQSISLGQGTASQSSVVPSGKLPVEFIAINDRHIYAASGADIYRAEIDDMPAGTGVNNLPPWPPTWSKVKAMTNAKGSIKYISVAKDGQLLAIRGDKIWALFENVHPETEHAEMGDKESVWEKVPNAEALAVFKVPVLGYDMFRGYLTCCKAHKNTTPPA